MKLFYRKSGSGQPLIILHGLFGLSDNWATLAKKWSDHFTVYAVDLRNHGQSPHSDQWKYWIMAEDILELIESEKLKDVTLLGHSMGGKVGMRLALDAPEEISKLIVSDIAPRKYPVHNMDVVAALRSIKPTALTSRKEAEESLSAKLKNDSTVQFLLKNLYWKEDGTDKQLAWRFNLDVIAKNLEMVSDATDSPAPSDVETLFLRAENSDYITDDDETEIKKIFPRSKVELIEDAGHWIHADKPEEMFHSVMQFAL